MNKKKYFKKLKEFKMAALHIIYQTARRLSLSLDMVLLCNDLVLCGIANTD